jgi:hypothetical protein
MGNPEREKPGKNVEYDNLLLTYLVHLGMKHGIPTHKLNVDVKTEKSEKSGAKITRTEPFILGTFRQAELKVEDENMFLLHNPHDISEQDCYLVSMGERSFADGEEVKQIVISKIPSPHKYENKREWVTEAVNATLNPYFSQAEFDRVDEQFPTLLISLYSDSAAISYSGELDKFLGEIYASFPDKEE